MIDWILSNLKLVVSGLLVIISVITFILRKKPTLVIDGVREDLFKWSLAAVSYIESKGIVGSQAKLDAAINYVYLNFMDKYYPNEEKEKCKFWLQYAELTHRYIEAILSTPSKKK